MTVKEVSKKLSTMNQSQNVDVYDVWSSSKYEINSLKIKKHEVVLELKQEGKVRTAGSVVQLLSNVKQNVDVSFKKPDVKHFAMVSEIIATKQEILLFIE